MAVTLSLAQLREDVETGLPDAALQRHLDAASRLIQDYAPDAPDALQNEAAIRLVSWLVDQPRASVRSEHVGEYKAEYAPSMNNALLHSGASPLLARYSERRLGVL